MPMRVQSGPSQQLTIVYRFAADLKPDPRNPRRHSKSQVRQIARSIETFGFLIPILIDVSGRIIAGHGRVQAAARLKIEEVPTILVEHLSEAQLRAYLVADNRLAETSSWDDALLAEQLKELSLLDLNFSLDVIGFDNGEIDFRIQALEVNASPEKADPADAIPTPLAICVNRPGDLWLMDEHRLLCGDALQATSYVTLMAGQLATVVFEDFPFNVKINGHVGGKGAIKHPEFAMASGEMSSEEFTQFLTTGFGHAAKHSKNGSIHFQCMDFRHIREITAAGEAIYAELKNLCVWVKNVGGMGSLYRSRHELIFVFKNGRAPHINNVELGRHGRYRTNVWDHRSINSIRRSTEEDDLLAIHPTIKPTKLVADALLDCSNIGDIVLDAFLGSGTTLLAAQRVNRICYGMEIAPQYVDTAIRRWQDLTGLDAVLATTGETFTERHRQVCAAAELFHGGDHGT